MNFLKAGLWATCFAFISSCQTSGGFSPEVLVFTPGLFPYSNIKRYEETQDSGFLKVNLILAQTENLDAAVIFYKRTDDKVYRFSPRTMRGTTRDWIKGLKKFKNRKPIFGREGESSTNIGKINYEHVNYGNTQCAHFLKPYRFNPRDLGGRYVSFLLGYICQSPNKTLEDQTIKAFLQQVSIKRKDNITIDEAGIKPSNLEGPLNTIEKKATTITPKVSGNINNTKTAVNPNTGKPIDKPVGKPAEDRLSELKRLLDAGLITEEEAARKRQEILDGI